MTNLEISLGDVKVGGGLQNVVVAVVVAVTLSFVLSSIQKPPEAKDVRLVVSGPIHLHYRNAPASGPTSAPVQRGQIPNQPVRPAVERQAPRGPEAEILARSRGLANWPTNPGETNFFELFR